MGTAVVDYLGVVPHYPAADSQLELGTLAREGGGNASTTLATIARLGASACFLGKLGDDELGKLALDSLADNGVNVEHVVIEAGGSAGFAFIIVDATSGQRTILWSNQGKPRLTGAELDPERVLDCRYLHLDEYEMEAATEAARIARGSHGRVTTVLDAESGLEGIDTLLPLVDIVIASETFALDYAGVSDYQGAARELHRRLPATVSVVTAGERGRFCVSEVGEFHQPAYAIDPVDTTGCGDVFRGGFIYGLLNGWTLPTSAQFASATAALKCRALGGRAGIPSVCEVREFLAAVRG